MTVRLARLPILLALLSTAPIASAQRAAGAPAPRPFATFEDLLDGADAAGGPTLKELGAAAALAGHPCGCTTPEATRECARIRQEATAQLSAWKGKLVRGTFETGEVKIGEWSRATRRVPVQLPVPGGGQLGRMPEGCELRSVRCGDEDEEGTVASMLDLSYEDGYLLTPRSDLSTGPAFDEDGNELILTPARADAQADVASAKAAEYVFAWQNDVIAEVVYEVGAFSARDDRIRNAARKQQLLTALDRNLQQYQGRPAAYREAKRLTDKRKACVATARITERTALVKLRIAGLRLWMKRDEIGIVDGLFHSAPRSMLPADAFRQDAAGRRSLGAAVRDCGDDLVACRYVAAALRWGRGIPKDLARAKTLFERTCAAGDRPSCAVLDGKPALAEGGVVLNFANGTAWTPEPVGKLAQPAAVKACEAITADGSSGWSLPSQNELETLRGLTGTRSIDRSLFPGVRAPVWSSSTHNWHTQQHRYVDFDKPARPEGFDYDASEHPVLCARPWPAPREPLAVGPAAEAPRPAEAAPIPVRARNATADEAVEPRGGATAAPPSRGDSAPSVVRKKVRGGAKSRADADAERPTTPY